MIGYDFHPEAETDFDELWEFIAQDNLAAADRVREDIIAAIEALVLTPNIGHRRPDLTSRPLRFFTVRNYLIAYAPDEKPSFTAAAALGLWPRF